MPLNTKHAGDAQSGHHPKRDVVRVRAWSVCVGGGYAVCRARGQARTATSAKAPVGSIAIPLGLENWALVPTPSLNPSMPVPASVVVSPLVRLIFRMRWLSLS